MPGNPFHALPPLMHYRRSILNGLPGYGRWLRSETVRRKERGIAPPFAPCIPAYYVLSWWCIDCRSLQDDCCSLHPCSTSLPTLSRQSGNDLFPTTLSINWQLLFVSSGWRVSQLWRA